MYLWNTHVNIVSLLHSLNLPFPSTFFQNCIHFFPFFHFLSSLTTSTFCLLLKYDFILFITQTDVISSLLTYLFFLFFCTKFGKSKFYIYCIYSLSAQVCFQTPSWSNPWCMTSNHCKLINSAWLTYRYWITIYSMCTMIWTSIYHWLMQHITAFIA